MVDVRFPGFRLPAEPDSSLTDGHLILLAPGKPGDGWWPSNSSSIPNLAAANAARLTGATADSATVFNTYPTTKAGMIERTRRNAPHFIPSRLNGVSGGTGGLGQGSGIQMPAAVRDYVQANPTHKYYLSMGFEVSRGYTAPSPTVYPLASLKSPNLAGTRVTVGITSAGVIAGTPGSTAAQRLGFTAVSHADNAERKFAAVTSDGYALSATLSTILLFVGGWDSTTAASAPSVVMHRMALVDVTAGTALNHAKVAAKDHAEWSRALTGGGYYYGEARGNPDTLVP